MLIVIHNLPFHFRYTDVKTLINDKCGLTEMIVDNLVEEGNSKKVTVGLADEGDAAILMRKINGLFVDNQQLYVENVRQKKTTEQPYRPSMDFYSGKASNNNPQPPIEQPYYMQQNAMQMPLQPPPFMMMDPSFMVAPNFNVPYYMSTPNVVENNQQFTVQYPMQGPPGNERYDAISRDQGDRELDGSRSPDRAAWENAPRRQIKWSEPAHGRSDDRRGRDRSPQRRDRPDAERSFTDKSYRGPFDSRINQYSEPKQSRFEKSSARSDSRWEADNSFQSNDNRSNDLYGRRPAHDRSQSYREDQYSKSRDPEYASRRDVSSNKKRPHDLPDNRFSPKSKKFGNNHEFNSRNQSETSGGAYQKINSNKFHNKPADLRPNMPHAHQNRPQSNREQVIPNRPLLPTPKAYQPKRQNETTPEFSKRTPIRPEEITPEIIARQESWRVHAAAVIANRINNQVARPRNKKDPVLMQLKACVRARLDVILGEDQTIILRDMISLYKEKFEDDKQFYAAVLEKVDKAINPERKMTGNDTFGKMNTGLKSNTMPSKTQKRTQLAPNEVPDCSKELPTHVDPSVERLPKYPNSNKKIMTQMKKAQKEEMENEILYKLDDFREKVLSDELDKIEELFVEELGTPANEVEKTLSNFMINVLKPDLRKILTLLIKKRILNIRTNLTLRLNCQPKAPKREQLDQFLKKYGVLSLKKSEKHNHVFIAVCDSFKSYDTLCELGRTCIGESSVTFKPLHITGPPAKGKLSRPLIKVVTNYGTNMNSNNEQNMKIDATKDTKITTADSTIEHLDSDCEVLPHKDQVIVIEDSYTQLKDYIVIDEVTDQGKGDENVLDKEKPSETVENSQCESIIDITIDACENIHASDVNKDTIDNPAETHADKVAVNDSQATAINEQDVNETEECGVLGVIDNENINEDDLEDF